MGLRYELTGVSDMRDGEKIYQIQALIDMPVYNVKAGDLGGWIASQKNLPQHETGWIDKTSVIKGNAILHSGIVEGNSIIDGMLDINCKRIYASNVSAHEIKKIISGLVSIENSTVINSSFGLRANISNSILEGVDCNAYNTTISNSEFSVSYDCEIEASFLLENSKCTVDHFFSNGRIEIKNVTGSCWSIENKEDAMLILRNLKLGGHTEITNYGDLDEGEYSVIEGEPENPIILHAVKLNMRNSSIENQVVVEGEMDLDNCRFTDFAKVKAYGFLSKVSLLHMSSLIVKESYKKTGTSIEFLNLIDDESVIFD